MLRSLAYVASRSISLHNISVNGRVTLVHFKAPRSNHFPLQSQSCCYSNNSGDDNNNGSGKDSSKKGTSTKDETIPSKTTQSEAGNETDKLATNEQSKDGKLAVLKEEIKEVRVAEKKKRQSLYDMWAERTLEKEPEETREEARVMIEQLRKDAKQVLRYQRDHLGNRVDAIDNCEMLVSVYLNSSK